MQKVFIDTGAFIAYFVYEDIDHEKIVEKYKEYRNLRALFITSDYILSELYTRLVYDIGSNVTSKAVMSIKKLQENNELKVLTINSLIFKRSTEALLKFSEHKISFTDATTYICVKEYKLDEVFTLDSDFKKIGLSVSFPNLKKK